MSGDESDRHDARDSQISLRCLLSEWRVGRRVSRNIYAMISAVATDDDILIGQMDTGQLAREAVFRHNDALKKR
ncbi:MAG TPA: hypothetical protein VFI41_04980 [Gemmatimonadales bacterium]|nr:hypothetical protein [Gemmatimonadales bacterium]